MLDEMRARPDDAHVAAQHVPKLRNFIDAQFAKPFSERINALVVIARLPRYFRMIGAHGAKFVDDELSILETGAGLSVQKWTRRLQSLPDPNQDGERRE